VDYNRALHERARYFIKKHPDRVPVVIMSSGDIEIKRKNYLVHKETTLGSFMATLRTYCTLQKHEALFILIKNVLPPMSATLCALHVEHKSHDDILYFDIRKEATFGSLQPACEWEECFPYR